MKAAYHRQITTAALHSLVSPRALEAILAANLSQDGWEGLFFHPEFHFDESRFQDGDNYLAARRDQARTALLQGDPAPAWQAFGRLSHAAQDFYAHSNYVRLFLEAHPPSLPSQIDPLAPAILNDPRLHSGHVAWGWELIAYFLPNLAVRLRHRIPANTHAGMNLDHPGRGPLFDFAVQAAIQRTSDEYRILLEPLDTPDRQLFRDLPG